MVACGINMVYRNGLQIEELILASCVLLVASLVLLSLSRQVSSFLKELFSSFL